MRRSEGRAALIAVDGGGSGGGVAHNPPMDPIGPPLAARLAARSPQAQHAAAAAGGAQGLTELVRRLEAPPAPPGPSVPRDPPGHGDGLGLAAGIVERALDGRHAGADAEAEAEAEAEAGSELTRRLMLVPGHERPGQGDPHSAPPSNGRQRGPPRPVAAAVVAARSIGDAEAEERKLIRRLEAPIFPPKHGYASGATIGARSVGDSDEAELTRRLSAAPVPGQTDPHYGEPGHGHAADAAILARSDKVAESDEPELVRRLSAAPVPGQTDPHYGEPGHGHAAESGAVARAIGDAEAEGLKLIRRLEAPPPPPPYHGHPHGVVAREPDELQYA